jgi:hypothetical protein
MAEAGFRYRSAPDVGTGGPTPESQANYDDYMTLPLGERKRYDERHQTCNREAYETVVVPAGEAMKQLFPKIRAETAAILDDPSVAWTVDEWIDCMASRGITATAEDLQDFTNDSEPFLTAPEDCARTSGLGEAAGSVARARWRDFATANYDLLLAMVGGSS